MSGDKKTIGVSAESQQILDIISDQTLYRDQVDAAKFAVSLALAKGFDPVTGSDLSTKWNVGSFDPTGDLRSAILAYRSECEEPYRAAEGLLEVGLVLLREHIEVHGQVDMEILLNELKADEQKAVAVGEVRQRDVDSKEESGDC